MIVTRLLCASVLTRIHWKFFFASQEILAKQILSEYWSWLMEKV